MKDTNKTEYKIISEVTDYKGLRAYMISPGILVTECIEDVHLDMETILELHEVGIKLSQNKARPHLFISNPGLTTTKEAREWGSSEEANELNTATAVVVKSLGQSILGNFFIKIQRPPTPTKLFSKKEPAIEWLRTFL